MKNVLIENIQCSNELLKNAYKLWDNAMHIIAKCGYEIIAKEKGSRPIRGYIQYCTGDELGVFKAEDKEDGRVVRFYSNNIVYMCVSTDDIITIELE